MDEKSREMAKFDNNSDMASQQSIDDVDQDSQSQSGSRRMYRRRQRSLCYRIWKFLRRAATGVISGDKPMILDLDLPQRYRPNNIDGLCQATGLSRDEVKKMYSSFKNECPSGLITPDVFHAIFSKFFPLGAALSSYSNYIFSTLDPTNSGSITFEDFAIGLSLLIKGSPEQRLRWTFALYDINKDGVLTRDEIRDVTASVYDLLGCPGGEKEKGAKGPNEDIINRRADYTFQRLDVNADGLVTLEEFLSVCLRDQNIFNSLQSLNPETLVFNK